MEVEGAPRLPRLQFPQLAKERNARAAAADDRQIYCSVLTRISLLSTSQSDERVEEKELFYILSECWIWYTGIYEMDMVLV